MEYTINKLTKSDYPHQLKQISQLPESMDIAGTLPGPENKFLCIIGSRRHSSYGRQVCEKLIAGLSGRPIVIVSGMALGIDSLAHEAAMKANLRTIAFPGSGLSLDVLYPQSKKALANQILETGGALISPFQAHQTATDWTFPCRNRLMAGISHAVLIIEAGVGSGTLLTAGYASDFNRDILAVPGSIFDQLSYGPNILLRDGAAPITCSEDIIRALGLSVEAPGQLSFTNFAELALSPEEKRIIAELQLSSQTSSELIEKTALSVTSFNTLASQLELIGVIIQNEGVYRLNH